MRVCILHGLDVGRLEHLGLRPDCHGHDHVRRCDAEQQIRAGVARWVGPKQLAITLKTKTTEAGYDMAAARKDDREWTPAPSGPCTVLQMVPAPRKRSMGRIKVRARSGARSGPCKTVVRVDSE